MKWTVDECEDARGFFTIRPHDGTPNGDFEADPIATVYDANHAHLVAAVPEMLAALKRLETAAQNRDNVMGDLCRLLDAKAELLAAAAAARDIIAKAEHRGGC